MNIEKRVIVVIAILILLASIIYSIKIISITGAAVIGTATTRLCSNPSPDIENLTTLSTQHNFPFLYDVNATDPNNDGFSLSDNTSLFNISSSGLINFTPNISSVGNHSILLKATDNFTVCPAQGYESLLLQITNTKPTNISIANQSWEEDIWLTGLNLTRYFSDADNDTLTYTVIAGDNIAVTVDQNAIVTFKPTRDWYGLSWAIFTANDTIEYQGSNNVSLLVTSVVNFCGDGICNSNESCSSCSTDCGNCPVGSSSSSSGGGGGRPRVTERLITIGNGTCLEQFQCGQWLPRSCLGLAQEQICLRVVGNCSIIERIESRNCLCEPQFQCSEWTPLNCSSDEKQERTCIDVNSCNNGVIPSTERQCEAGVLPGSEAQLNTPSFNTPTGILPLMNLAGQSAASFGQSTVNIVLKHYWLLAFFLILAAFIVWITRVKAYYKSVDKITFPLDEYQIEIETGAQMRLGHNSIIEDLNILSNREFYVYRRRRKIE